MVIGNCGGVEHWTEQWRASGTLNEKINMLTLKLWFEAGPRTGTSTCQGPSVGSDVGRVGRPGAPVGGAYTSPGFRSDAHLSPLDQFTLADKEGAAQHFVIPLGPLKQSIDVTVVSPHGGGAAQ